MGKYICSTCLKEFKQKSHYDKHTNKKKPCINNINKIIINETIENKFNEIMNKKLELSNNKQIKIELNIDNNIIKQSLHNTEQLNKEKMIEVKNDPIIQKKNKKEILLINIILK